MSGNLNVDCGCHMTEIRIEVLKVRCRENALKKGRTLKCTVNFVRIYSVKLTV